MPSNVRPASPLAFRLGPGRGPLVRASDRMQFVSRVVAVLVVLIAVPVAMSVGSAKAAELRAAAQHELTTRFAQQATLVADAEAASGPSLHYYRLRVPAPATWTSPDGEDRSGTIEVAPGTPAGASVEIWTDAAGRLSQAPPSDDVLVGRGAVTGLATFAAVAFGAFLAHAVVRRHLDRARHRRWDEEWAIVEPVWSRRVR